jgi:hypothetical protein
MALENIGLCSYRHIVSHWIAWFCRVVFQSEARELQCCPPISTPQPMTTETPLPIQTATLTLEQKLPGCVLVSTINKNTLVPYPICIYGYVNGHSELFDAESLVDYIYNNRLTRSYFWIRSKSIRISE